MHIESEILERIFTIYSVCCIYMSYAYIYVERENNKANILNLL